MDDVIHDWNVIGERNNPMPVVEVHDETLRDGIQCPSVHDPDIDDKLAVVRLMGQIGIDSIDVGLPGAGPRAVADSQRIIELIRDEKLPLRPACAARTIEADIRPILEIAERTGLPVEVMAFIGSSPIRMYTENWGEDRLEELTRSAMKLSSSAGMPTSYVTEDTIRSRPSTLRRIFTAAIEEGADRLVLCDTVGHATPDGVYNLVTWTRRLVDELGAHQVKLDWHGHNDRGLALVNAMAAAEAGVDRVHGTVLGIGERVGNTSVDQLLVNLRLLGQHDQDDLVPLARLVDTVSAACRWPIPVNYPVFGEDAFRTGTGVHAAAVIKAQRKGDAWLADRIYSGVPAGWFGRNQEITVGHQSGLSNIRFWLENRGLDAKEETVQAIFQRAKSGSRMLSEAELLEVVQAHA